VADLAVFQRGSEGVEPLDSEIRCLIDFTDRLKIEIYSELGLYDADMCGSWRATT
jgi:hypothetical protein